jgi:excisionase family DNA binding protein
MTIQDFQPELLRPSQVRKRYNIPRDRLYQAIRDMELPAVDVGSCRRPSYLIRIADLEAWLQRLTTKAKK